MTGEPALRAATDADEAFLREVYASTRERELALLPLDEPQQQAFLGSQHRALLAHLQARYPGEGFQVVLVDGVPAGRLFVHREPGRVHIVDIALLPRFRGAGAGSALLRSLLAQADAAGERVSAYVERHNRALSLYVRLGFGVVEDGDVHLLLERAVRPSKAS